MTRSRVTTKNGDAGTTRTLGGEVLPKGHPVLECTGWVDALRAQTALVRLHVLEDPPAKSEAIGEFLLWLLHVYFLIGSAVNDPENRHPEYHKDTLGPKHLAKLEQEQARLESDLQLPRAFIVSASNTLAAEFDVTATVARTLERRLVELKATVPAFDADEILRFVNRLSDFLYVLARFVEKGKHHPVDYSVLDADT